VVEHGVVEDGVVEHGVVVTQQPGAGAEAGLGHGAGSVAANLAEVRRRIASAGGDQERIRVVAVTKGFGPEVVQAAVDAGLLDLGENYAQELLAKSPVAPPGVRWHFLGPVQRNKVTALAPHVQLWQAIDRLAAGEAIAKRQPGGRVLVQVNVSGEPSKAGCLPADTAALVQALGQLDLSVEGLMAVGPLGDPEDARPGFRLLAQMAADLGLRELSIGMSEDLEIAVEEGATMVRIGRALFGPRLGSPRLRR
jgi:pyridoxal phosphate enzyme (YggS family)